MSKPITVREWQEMFAAIYGSNNARLNLDTIWVHMVEEMGEVAKDLRLQDYQRLRVDLPDVFAWLCAFSDRAAIILEDAVWEKYPRICPYCDKQEHCVCIGGGFHSYDRKRMSGHAKKGQRPVSLSDWQDMFRRIYGNVNKIVVDSSIGFHLMEEVGELAKQLRKGNHDGYHEGVADVFAWIIALSMKLTAQLGKLDEAIYDVYPGVCKECKQPVCVCDPNTLVVRG